MNIHALVGPSGTGKSHRASMVAEQINADSIIDDGLLIVDGRIVAGVSAKREATRVAAVKRAILADEDHAAAVKDGLKRLAPHDVLILGTSKEMIRHILAALDLSQQPINWIRIEQVTTLEERQVAQQVRRQQGKHVIPAPAMEVKKSFGGYWVDPLRFMFRGRHRQMVVEKSIVRPTYSSLGKFYIADTVIAAVASHIGRNTPGISRVVRTVVQSNGGFLSIEMEVWLGTRRNIFQVLEETQKSVHDMLEEMTAVNVGTVKIHARRIVVEEAPVAE